MAERQTRTLDRAGDSIADRTREIGFLEKLSPSETLILAAIVMTGLAGVMLIGKGLALNADVGLL